MAARHRDSTPSWGLVLSGGAAYGLANAGILDVLDREGLRPDFLAGSSMGAIVGALYALGYPTAIFDDLMTKLGVKTAVTKSAAPLKGGLHGGLLQQNLRYILEPIIGTKSIADCEIPFVVVAGRVKEPIAWTKIIRHGFTDSVVERVEPVILPPETRLLDALMATSAIPIVFSPYEIGGHQYIDLVHFGSVPARSLRKTYAPDIVIATDTNPTFQSVRRFLPRSWKEFLDRGHEELQRSLEAADLVIKPHLPAAMFRFDKAAAFREAGRVAAEETLPQVRALLATGKNHES